MTCGCRACRPGRSPATSPPAGAAPRSLPAILCVHGAGVYTSNLHTAAAQAQTYHALAMDMNAHGITNGQPQAFYQALDAGDLKGYPFAGREDRQQCYFLGMFLRLVRAIEFLTSQPEWDGKVLIVQGSSQGGGQAIAAAGLDPRVTLISAGVPAICDHTGGAIGRISGWPRLVPETNGRPDPKVLQVSRYFDCANFAARTRAEALFSVGFIDVVCPPTSVYAAYNALKGKRSIVNEPLMGHAVSAEPPGHGRGDPGAHRRDTVSLISRGGACPPSGAPPLRRLNPPAAGAPDRTYSRWRSPSPGSWAGARWR